MYSKKDFKEVILFIIGCLLIIILLFIFDYFNLFTLLAFDVLDLNFEFWSIFFNIFVAIFIFGVTYILVEKRQNDIIKNKRNLLITLIGNTYSNCLFWIDILSDDKLNNLLFKIKMNKNNKNKVYDNILDNVFENHGIIIEFLKDGLINENIIESYIKIKRDFNYYVTNTRLTFNSDFDKKKQESELKEQLNIEIKKLDELKKLFDII